MGNITIVDVDRVVMLAQQRLKRAIDIWLRGFPRSEEALMNHITGELLPKRNCDVGLNQKALGTVSGLELHRRGPKQTDRYGSDMAVTFAVPRDNFVKTAFLQLKKHTGDSVKIEMRQLQDALELPYVAGRAFAVAVSEDSRSIRLKSVGSLVSEQGRVESRTARIDESWLGFSRWLLDWLRCDIGDPSSAWDWDSPERHLQTFAPRDTALVWGVHPVDEPGQCERMPTRVWIRHEYGGRPDRPDE